MENLSKKKKAINLVLLIGIVVLLTLSFKLISLIAISGIRFTMNCLVNLLFGLVGFLFIKKSKMKTDWGFKNGKAYLIGIAIALVLQVIIGIIPALLGQSLVGSHRDFVFWSFIYCCHSLSLT